MPILLKLGLILKAHIFDNIGVIGRHTYEWFISELNNLIKGKHNIYRTKYFCFSLALTHRK